MLHTWKGTIDRTYGGLGFSATTAWKNNWHIIDDVRIITEGTPFSQTWKSEDIGYVQSIVVDDLDGDGTNEIIVGTCTDYESNTHYIWHGYIYIFNAITHELE